MMTARGIIRKMRNILDEVVEKIKTHILRSVTFFQKNLWDNVEKYITGHRWNYNTAYALGILHN